MGGGGKWWENCLGAEDITSVVINRHEASKGHEAISEDLAAPVLKRFVKY